MDFNQRFHAANLAIEQGLQSTSLPDVLAAITDTPAYIEQMPFPVFVNTVLLRLAEAFQGEKLSAKLEQFVNMTRLRIVKSVKEFSHHLHVAFSGDEIVRRIMKVSHSNDYYARSLTLLFLAALAPLISENKKVHHLLIESLDCDEDTELQSAIFAITEFGKYSSAFPSIVLEKLSEVLCSNEASTEVKIRLLNVISNFKETYAVTSNCLGLGKDLLKQNCDLPMQMAVYNSTTALASRSSLAIPDQISTLIDALSESFSNKALASGLFKDICKLARFPQHWKAAQVKTLRDFFPRLTEMNSDRVIESWLEAMQNLTSSGLYVDILSGDKGGPWIQLLSGENIKLRISCAQLVRNLLTCGEAEHFQGLLLSSISATIGDIRATTEMQNKVRFYKFVGSFARLPQCIEKNAAVIVQSLVEHIPSMQISHLPDLGLLLQTLCAICDDHPKCGCAVSRWTIESLFLKAPIENVGIFPMELYSLMFASWSENSHEKILERLLKAPVNRWTLYKIARVALRYGHWKSMAVPILEKVKECCESMETSSWIGALISIAGGQVTAFTAAKIGESYGILKKSVVMLEILSATPRKEKCFDFASSFTDCLAKTWKAIKGILTMLNIKILTLSGWEGTAHRDRQILAAMPFLLSQVAEARNSWVALYQRSFDVDSRTLSLIHLLSQLNQNVENALLFMSGQPLGPVTVSDENRRGLINTRLADKVVYTKNTLVKLDASVPSKKTGGSAEFSPRLTTNMLKNFRELFKQLFDFPLGLPRAFFQSAFHTYIKLNITPQPRDNETSVTISAPALPLTLEGVIESNNPRRIQSITIQAEVAFLRDATGQNGYEQERIIELSKGDTYFKSQFLLQITEPAKINVHVSFSDSESKKVWIDESASATLSVVCAFAAQ